MSVTSSGVQKQKKNFISFASENSKITATVTFSSSEENLLFVESVAEFEKIQKTLNRNKEAHLIFEEFLKKDSINELNLDSETVDRVQHSLLREKISSDIFEEIKVQILFSISDPVRRFLNSDELWESRESQALKEKKSTPPRKIQPKIPNGSPTKSPTKVLWSDLGHIAPKDPKGHGRSLSSILDPNTVNPQRISVKVVEGTLEVPGTLKSTLSKVKMLLSTSKSRRNSVDLVSTCTPTEARAKLSWKDLDLVSKSLSNSPKTPNSLPTPPSSTWSTGTTTPLDSLDM
jgi:hypothetical protein